MANIEREIRRIRMRSFMRTLLGRGDGAYLDLLPILFFGIGFVVLLITLIPRLLAELFH